MKDSLIFYQTQFEAVRHLSDEDLGRLFRALFNHAQGGEAVQLTPELQMAFSFISMQIERDSAKYSERCERNRENIRKRYAKQKEEKPNTNVTDVFNRIQSNTNVTDNDNENDNENDNDNENENDNDVLYNENSNINLEDIKSSLYVGKPTTINYRLLVKFFNFATKGIFGNVKMPISEKRRESIKARVREHGMEDFVRVIELSFASAFLKGQNTHGWRMTFDWMIRPTNFEKILSGNYSDGGQQTLTKTQKTMKIQQELLEEFSDEDKRLFGEAL